MSFFDTYQESEGNWIGKQEKEALVEDATEFPIFRVSEGTGFEGKGKSFVLEIELDGERRLISFGQDSVGSRDDLLRAYQGYLLSEESDGSERFYLARKKQAILIKNADEKE